MGHHNSRLKEAAGPLSSPKEKGGSAPLPFPKQGSPDEAELPASRMSEGHRVGERRFRGWNSAALPKMLNSLLIFQGRFPSTHFFSPRPSTQELLEGS